VKEIWTAAASAGLAMGGPEATAGDLTVTVENVPNTKGVMAVGLCSEAAYETFDCEKWLGEDAEAGAMTFVFEDVTPGRWAVTALHDENENNKLDFRWYGPPKEAYGSSRNPPPRMGPARWDDIALEVGEDDMEISITLLGAGS